MALYERLKEELDDAVGAVFGAWCKANNIHVAYGVESWEYWGDTLRIVQDTSCRGCYNNEHHSIPSAPLFMSPEERTEFFTELTEKNEKRKTDKKKAEKKALIKDLERRLQEALDDE